MSTTFCSAKGSPPELSRTLRACAAGIAPRPRPATSTRPAFLRIPRQDLRGAVHVRIRQPRLRRVHRSRRHQRALFARVDAGVVCVIAEEQKRRQRALRLDHVSGAHAAGSRGCEWAENPRLRLRPDRCRLELSWWSRGQCRCSCWLHTLAHVELQLPAAAVARDAPELQHAGFGDHGFESDAAPSRRRLRSAKVTSTGRQAPRGRPSPVEHVRRRRRSCGRRK